MSDRVEIRHLRYFVAVAEDLSFTRAADRLGIAQPPLSQQIRALENMIGQVLFQRRPVVRLTPAGRSFLIGARQTLLRLDQSIRNTRETGGSTRGVVHVGVASSVPLSPAGRLLGLFRKQAQGIDLRLHELHSADQLDGLQHGTLDAGLMREPTMSPSFLTHEITREQLVVALPDRHRLNRLSVVPSAALADETFVLFPRSSAPALHDQIVTLCREAGFSPRIGQEVGEWHTILALVATGFGVSIMPASVATLRVRGSVARAITPSVARAAIFLCAPRAPSTPAAEAFVRFMVGRSRRARG